MQKFILLIIVVFVSCVANAQGPSCNKVKNGVFQSVIEIGGERHVTKITRKGNKQTEENEATGLKLEFDVKWTSDCTYELSNLRTIKGNLPGASDKHILWVTITGVTKDSYQADVSSNFTEGKLEMIFSIIK